MTGCGSPAVVPFGPSPAAAVITSGPVVSPVGVASVGPPVGAVTLKKNSAGGGVFSVSFPGPAPAGALSAVSLAPGPSDAGVVPTASVALAAPSKAPVASVALAGPSGPAGVAVTSGAPGGLPASVPDAVTLGSVALHTISGVGGVPVSAELAGGAVPSGAVFAGGTPTAASVFCAPVAVPLPRSKSVSFGYLVPCHTM